MTRKNETNIKLHSKRTGAIILIVFACLVVIAGVWLYLVIDEASKIQKYEEQFRLMPCEEMEKIFKQVLPRIEWQRMAIIDKGC